MHTYDELNMKEKPLVSIITACHNRIDYLEESIQSILNQTHSDFEYIIFDDCSTDGSREVLESFTDPRIVLVKHTQNTGFTKGMINAVSQAKGKYIAVHGIGDISFPRRIEKQVQILEANGKVGLVGCLRNMVDKTQNKDMRNWVDGKTFLGDASKEVLITNMFNHGEVMFRKSIYFEVGGYREVFTFAQDRDLWIRMSRICDFCVLPEILYERYFLDNSVSVNPEKRLVQKLLTELTIQCGERFKQGELDVVDQFGKNAPFFLKKSKRLSVELSKIAFKWLGQGRLEAAKLFVSTAILQDRNLTSIIIWSLVFKIPASFSTNLIKSRRSLLRKK